MYDTVLEVVGYVASAIVLISFFMSSVIKLRLVNLIGGAIFTVYACLTHSYPTAFMNLCIVVVDIYYLIKLTRPGTRYTMLPVRLDDPYLKAFLEFHGNDIRKYFPNLDTAISRANIAYFIYRDMIPAGLLLGNDLGNGTLEVLIDYSTPAYRNGSTGRFLYAALPDRGINKLVCNDVSRLHEKYLEKMAFAAQSGGYVKEL